MKVNILLLVISVLCLPVLGGPSNVLSLEQALAIALADNPGLAQMQARFQAKLAIPVQARSLPDPILSFGALNFPTDSFAYKQEAMTRLQLGISQKFLFPGKLALREQAATFVAEAALDNVGEVRLHLMRDVRTSWWSIHYLDRALGIVENNQVLLRQFVTIARTKYEVGRGMQQDVLLAQLELSKLLDRKIQLVGARSAEVAQLNQLVGRDIGRPVLLPDLSDRVLPELIDESELVKLAQLRRPKLARGRNKVRAAESMHDLAKKNYYPDFTLGAEYGFRGGHNPTAIGGQRADFLSLKVSLNLPLYPKRKRASALSQRASEVQIERYALQDHSSAVRAEIFQAKAAYIQARDQYSLFGTGIIPQARQTVQSMLAAYQVSEVDFLNLVRSQITLFDFETQYWRAYSIANQALARLQAAVGVENVYE